MQGQHRKQHEQKVDAMSYVNLINMTKIDYKHVRNILKKYLNENCIFTTAFHFNLQTLIVACLRGRLLKYIFFVSKMCSLFPMGA